LRLNIAPNRLRIDHQTILEILRHHQGCIFRCVEIAQGRTQRRWNAESTFVVQAELILSQQHRSVPFRNSLYPLSPTSPHSIRNYKWVPGLCQVKSPGHKTLRFRYSQRLHNERKRRQVELPPATGRSKQDTGRQDGGYLPEITYIQALTAGQSRSISRVLFRLSRQAAMIIPLGHTLPHASSDLTRRHRASNPYPTAPHAWLVPTRGKR
jgi:hypothetical protein